ncbi:S9 family peptidase isoform X1 [Dunckerocampus dactyliophorus]|uniref:S9 family peptidase isoform X1 n=1 Tax=Dunckerocampus dactyliophorus TaxID=161453 RepID=UPI0024067D8B|nr:S9 family peptidase isoform X1 [Dunckerocampus dactyliophorus]XP_054644851.1 S9 family peptidase isoform X1 [Dunckerocampus dactyliophorus]XP_054644860.1 S9 family peptidase isoform X1 [Dunckerocampus dactyliophorus]XP_054644869.1 S9 family peptidase isoform X1 [Dunckerocampus dactyliophorus]
MDSTQVARIHREVSSLPAAFSADVRQQQPADVNVITVTAGWSQADAVRGSRLCYSQQWTLILDSVDQSKIRTVLPPGPCGPLSAELLSGLSPIGGVRAVVRDTGGQQLMEIWDHHGLRKCLNLTALNKHGSVYDNGQFGVLSWSQCESKLLYIAEKLKQTTDDDESAWGMDRSVYCDDWGESLTSRSTPVICVLNLCSGAVDVLNGIPADVSPGQACWAPGSQCVFFVGWYHEPFRLGLKFCSNRRSALFQLSMDGHCERLTGDDLSVSCPRLSPDGSTLIYLQGQVFGPHHQCLSLQQLDLTSKKTSTLVDVISRPQTDGFAGIYEALPSCCWSTDCQRVVFSSACQNRKDLFVVDRRSKKVTSLSGLSDTSKVYGSWKILTIQRDLMVVCCSSPNTPPTLLVGFLPSSGETVVAWQPLQEPITTFDFMWTVLEVEPPPEEDNAIYPGVKFGAVLVKPHGGPLHGVKTPLVVFIHGGPHSQFAAEWNITTAGLVSLGFAVLMVNYRGSTGFGQDSILSLVGHIGRQDVKDVQRAVLAVLHSDATLDQERMATIGGSHGGFLSCHLVAQYPDFYRACAARNPVINAATLLGTSDIVDWRYTSVGLQYSYNQTPTAEALVAMLERSPIIHATQIKTPVLLMLGGRDRRVSPHQGLELYKALKSRASPVRLLWFAEDGHSLSRVDTQAQCFLNIVLWLHQHL